MGRQSLGGFLAQRRAVCSEGAPGLPLCCGIPACALACRTQLLFDTEDGLSGCV